jgi:Flp pilus assembly protein TadG
MRHRPARGSDRARGSIAVEYAIVLPALLMFLLGLVDAGRLFWSYTTLSRSVAAASRCAAVDTINCRTAAAVQSYAAVQAWGLGLASSAFTVTTAACGTQVQGTMVFGFVTPWFYVAAPFGASNTLTLSAAACYPT